jgi:hypothetical protein
MVLAAAWKLKQNGSGYGLAGPNDPARELGSIESSIQVLDFCGHRNPFARRYSSLIKDLRRQLVGGLQVSSATTTPGSVPPLSSLSSSASVADSGTTSESPHFEDLRISVEQSSGGLASEFSFPSDGPLDGSLEGWPLHQFETLSPGADDPYTRSI